MTILLDNFSSAISSSSLRLVDFDFGFKSSFSLEETTGDEFDDEESRTKVLMSELVKSGDDGAGVDVSFFYNNE